MSNEKAPYRVRAAFGPETRFEVKPAPVAPFRAVQEDGLEKLKNQLLQQRLEELWDGELNTVVRQVANEAAAIAWATRYPLLVFPALFEEKVESVLAHADHQDEVRRLSRELLAV